MVAQRQPQRNNIAYLVADSFDHPQEIVPSVPASSNIVVVGHVSSNENNIRFDLIAGN